MSLKRIAEVAARYRDSLSERHVDATASAADLRQGLAVALPGVGEGTDAAVSALIDGVEPGLVASTGPRYFGFVVGGVEEAALQADWLTSLWDQNAQCYATSPAAAVVEEIVADWLLELLDLPRSSSVGFVTGCQMANFTAIRCALSTVLERAGWDVDAHGLVGAPEPVLLLSDCAHATVLTAARMAGLGERQTRAIASDERGCLRLDLLERAVEQAGERPLIVSLQAGNVNSGAFEPIDRVAQIVAGRNAWIHVDGAFGLWATLSPPLKPLLAGLERADSWATDAHKWLNVPYDSGLIFIKDSVRHRLKSARCAYVGERDADRRDGSDWAPENSRRARAFVLYAAIRAAGREGLRGTVERCCRSAREFAQSAARHPDVDVVNDVVLNQVLLRLDGDAAYHERVAERIRTSGRAWIGATVWKGQPALRVSVCGARTDSEDIARTVMALAHAL